MGLIRAAVNSVRGTAADQWKEYFYCDSLDNDVLAVKGHKRVSSRGSNKGSDNIISNGSVIAIADGQCMLIVDQGAVVDVCAEPGEYIYDMSSEPSVFSGDLGDSIRKVFDNVCKRFTFGGQAAKDQRVYYFNTKEIPGNKYGTPSPVPFRVVDERAGIDMDISIRCFGEYSIRITNPLLFYTALCGNMRDEFTMESIASQMKTELLTALQPAFSKLSEKGVRYSALPGHTMEMADALNDVLSHKWKDLRGMEIVSFGISSVTADPDDEKTLKELQRNASFGDARVAYANMNAATIDAIRNASSNAGGAALGFMNMNMAAQAGAAQINGMFRGMQPQSGAPAQGIWKCSCGASASGNFCPECGAKKPEDGWKCSCGTVNKGKFCTNCGAKKPAGEPLYKCDKCGWEPADPQHPPKFCPECGDPFDDSDKV